MGLCDCRAPWPLSPGGKYLAWRESQGEEHRIKVWDASEERLVQEIPTDGPHILRNFSPTHLLLVAEAMNHERSRGPEDGTIILDPVKGVRLGEADPHPYLSESEYTFSPCGRWFVSGVPEVCPLGWHGAPPGTILLTDLASILPLATPIRPGGA